MSSVNIAELLDQMDEVIENATASMLSSKRYIDIPAMQELIAQARENLPTEIEQATQIVRDRSAILKDAKQEAHETQEAAIRNADNLRENARREAEALTSKARLEADTMMEKARRDSKAMMQKAQDASDDMVAKAEEKAKALVSEDQIHQTATAKANEMLTTPAISHRRCWRTHRPRHARRRRPLSSSDRLAGGCANQIKGYGGNRTGQGCSLN